MSIQELCSAICPLNSSAGAHLNRTSPWTIISPGWTPEPNAGRGTMDIVWTCLVTIFACSWTVTHPAVPSEKYGHSKIYYCVMAIVAPEVLAYFACNEYLNVRHHFKAIRSSRRGQWTMPQTFFVDMRGVRLEFEDCTETLECDDLRRALQLNVLDMKSISVENVRRRAKTNYTVKALVCLQALWLVIQVIGRAAAKIPITTLEVVTVGYVVCALVTYSLWWHKPQDAEVQITVDFRNLTKANFHQQINEVDIECRAKRWRDFALLGLICGTFGAVHCTAWNFYFSTFAESVTWKVASVLTMVEPMLLPSLFYIPSGGVLAKWAALFAGVLSFFVYVPVRLYLMVEPFAAFRSVPAGIFYTVPWATWIPHV